MKGITILLLLIFASLGAQGQNERKVIREGVKDYEKGNFSEAEVQFRKAEDMNQESFEAEFNTGAALYGQEKYQETVKQYESMVNGSSDPEKLSKIWHNMGNSLLEAQQYQASIEAYKNSLRLNPSDMDTKYNLAYARQKMEEQQQQQNPQNQDQQDKQQQNQNQQDQNQQDQNQQDQNQQAQNQQDQDQQAQNQQDQSKASAQEISREDAERMLSAIQQQEKDVKEKVDKQKAAVAKVKTEKDW